MGAGRTKDVSDISDESEEGGICASSATNDERCAARSLDYGRLQMKTLTTAVLMAAMFAFAGTAFAAGGGQAGDAPPPGTPGSAPSGGADGIAVSGVAQGGGDVLGGLFSE